MIDKKKRVAAYVRIGGDHNEDSMRMHMQMQTRHYERAISEHGNWEFAGIYADSGSGTWDITKRPGLARLLEDCRTGQVDVILTKSASRLHRNVVSALEIARELLGLTPPVGIIFENEGINTLDERMSLFVQLFERMAIYESEHKHEHMPYIFLADHLGITKKSCNKSEEGTDHV